ncbi:MAG: metallophosphoesterase family protein [bacterium]|nr:metallophosphoesterase family protein [bacterium]
MRIAIFSDIHGNLEALSAVLKYLEEEGITNYICGGDIVGYGANPNECVDMVAALDCPVVMGNHDHAALGLTDITYFNPTARSALLWTRENLTQERKKFLNQLEFTYQANNMYLVHASPRHPEQWEYILSLESAETNFGFFKEQVCFIGHSHQPFFVGLSSAGNVELIIPKAPPMKSEQALGFTPTKPGSGLRGSTNSGTENPLQLKKDWRYIINVGSVGQPRDGNPNSAISLFDVDAQTVSLIRIPYDIKKAQEKIIEAGLPHSLAQRLENGW